MRKVAVVFIFALISATAYLIVRDHPNNLAAARQTINRAITAEPEIKLIKNPRTTADKIVNGAKTEAIRRVIYNAGYQQIDYPMGDVPEETGACTDVVIRALRAAGYDLQQLIHQDMKRNFNLYPRNWGLSRPDSNIDHRRVPNQMVFFQRFGQTLPNSTQGADLKTWKPGDIVCWRFGQGLTHTGVVSNEKNSNGIPLVIHNLSITREEDCLNSWPIIGHYRYPPD